jgi:hypothetical protein
VLDLAQALQVVVGEQRVAEDDLVAVVGRLVEQVALRPDRRRQAHHDVLPDRVDRGVRDLREALLEVGEQRRLPLGENRQSEVVAHRAGRLSRVAGDLCDQDAQVLLRVTEGELALDQGLAQVL